MRTLARFCLSLAVCCLFAALPSILSAQQYNRGIVLDPLQPGNINRIFERERNEWRQENANAAARQPVERLTWDGVARRAFRNGEYAQAANLWRYALVDEPTSGVMSLRLAQAQFATGNYDDAAGAVQTAMPLLPYQQWGAVVKNYKELYPNNQTFTNQLRALEKARKENPLGFAPRFVLGYQYIYLGYPKQAAAELQVALELQPDNLFAQQLAAVASGGPIPVYPTVPSPTPAPAPATKAPTGGSAAPAKTPAAQPNQPQINPPD